MPHAIHAMHLCFGAVEVAIPSFPLCTCPQEYVSLSFSADGKMLLAQGGAPEYNLVLWVWEKSKVAAVVKTTNQQASPVHSVSPAACI